LYKGGKDMKRIYLDHGATTPVDKEVVKAMLPYLTEKFGNASSIHSFGQEAKDALESSRERIAKKLGAKPNEIIFTSGGSESDNLAIKGVAHAYRKKGNHIITSSIEHPAVLGACKSLAEEGFDITYLEVDKEGFVKPDDVERAITKKTILVSIMHANNEIGTIEPIEEIGKICKSKGVLFHTDAVQSFTKVPIDVNKMNIDLLSISAHKIYGPKGVGALYIREGVKIKKMIDGGHHEFDMRAGTENIPGIVGFAKAVELTNENQIKYMTNLRNKLIKGLLKIPDTILNGPDRKNLSRRLCNNVNISFKFVEGESILLRLDDKGIAVSTGSACSSRSLKPSHVLLAIGLPPQIAHSSIRFTLGRENTIQEINYTIKTTKEVVEELRKLSPFCN